MALASAAATVRLSASRSTPRMSRPRTAVATERATSSQFGVSVNLTPGGRATLDTGHHDQSVLSPPKRSTGLCSGAMSSMRCRRTGLTAAGFVPAYSSSALISIERPTKPDAIGWPIAAPVTLNVGRADAFLAVLPQPAAARATTTAARSARAIRANGHRGLRESMAGRKVAGRRRAGAGTTRGARPRCCGRRDRARRRRNTPPSTPGAGPGPPLSRPPAASAAAWKASTCSLAVGGEAHVHAGAARVVAARSAKSSSVLHAEGHLGARPRATGPSARTPAGPARACRTRCCAAGRRRRWTCGR